MATIINNSDTTLSIEAQEIIRSFAKDMEVESVTVGPLGRFKDGNVYFLYDQNDNHIGDFDVDGCFFA